MLLSFVPLIIISQILSELLRSQSKLGRQRPEAILLADGVEVLPACLLHTSWTRFLPQRVTKQCCCFFVKFHVIVCLLLGDAAVLHVHKITSIVEQKVGVDVR